MPTQKRVIINTRERLVSTDINRMQAFSAAERAQFFAAVCADGPDYSIPTAISYPSTAIVVSGLLVRPYTGYCLIDGGSGLFPGALGDSDDFPVAFAASDGVTSTSVLPFVSNGLGVIRVDVFECRPLEVLDESSSRDIYDPLTGSFSAAVVDKVRSLKLEYRVRNGTPALDADSGWLPLAVAFVKPSDTGYDTADFYDVRPLLAERVWTSNRAGGRSVSRIDIDLYGSSTSLETGVEGFSSGAAYGFVAGCVEGETQGGSGPSHRAGYGRTRTIPDRLSGRARRKRLSDGTARVFSDRTHRRAKAEVEGFLQFRKVAGQQRVTVWRQHGFV